MEKVTEKIINIGVNDYDIDLFEGQYMLEKGMAYNSYVILDDKIAVMDTVDSEVTDEWMNNLKEAVGDKKVDYVIVHHMEPDHSGSLYRLLEEYPDIKIVGNAKTFPMLHQFLNVDTEGKEIVVNEGEVLELGEHTLKFIMAPMVHWPEVMVSYEECEKVVFSADSFGKFGTRDADEDWACEARRYYFNIVGKYGMQVQMLLKKLATLDVKVICPLHGPVLDENLDYYINKYDIWSKYEPEDKGVFIAYASIHGNTAKVAERFKEILEAKGVEKVAIADLSREDIHESVEDSFRYDRVVFAASSYDGSVFPPMEVLLNKLKAKNFQKRKVGLIENGSWGPTAARTMRGILETMKDIEIVEPVVTIKSSMKDGDEEKLEELANALL